MNKKNSHYPESTMAKYAAIMMLVFFGLIYFPIESKADFVAAEPCSKEKNDEIHQDVTLPGVKESVLIDCTPDIDKTKPITKRLLLKGSDSSNVLLDCNGGKINENRYFENHTIKIMSEEVNTFNWQRPENIIIRNCHITGSIHIEGMNTKHESFKQLSNTTAFTSIARRNAPRGIVLDNITIHTIGDTALYLHMGVGEVTLKNSALTGKTDGAVIYMDAETYQNTIENNQFLVDTSEREVMAVDGSSHNKIINNYFKGLDTGGIYLYRNCGQAGISRHTTPSNNLIINNRFYYNNYPGKKPAIYIGSRNGRTRKGKKGYCDDDKGHRYGSGASDLDHAQHNVIMQNQIFKRSTEEMIKNRNELVNTPNYIGYNVTVKNETVDNYRLAGCFVPQGLGTDFISHGDSISVPKIISDTSCSIKEYDCNNGSLEETLRSRIYGERSRLSCRTRKINFDVSVAGSNKLHSELIGCSANEKIYGAYGACDLELGPKSAPAFNADGVPVNTIRVIKASDNVEEGLCFIGDNKLRDRNTLKIGQRMISGINGQQAVHIGCTENEQYGGDCQIKGALYCGRMDTGGNGGYKMGIGNTSNGPGTSIYKNPAYNNSVYFP